MLIFNLTQHEATPAQLADGVVEPSPEVKATIRELITFGEIPLREDMETRAEKLVSLLGDYPAAMVGGAPYFMPILDKALRAAGKTPLYSFSKRVSEDVPQEDGTVKKVTSFKHAGWVY